MDSLGRRPTKQPRCVQELRARIFGSPRDSRKRSARQGRGWRSDLNWRNGSSAYTSTSISFIGSVSRSRTNSTLHGQVTPCHWLPALSKQLRPSSSICIASPSTPLFARPQTSNPSSHSTDHLMSPWPMPTTAVRVRLTRSIKPAALRPSSSLVSRGGIAHLPVHVQAHAHAQVHPHVHVHVHVHVQVYDHLFLHFLAGAAGFAARTTPDPVPYAGGY
jgi:hypothetical protein